MNLSGIRNVRKRAGLSQEQLAEIIGINRATLSKYESSQIVPSLDQLTKIAKALNTTVYEMIGDSAKEYWTPGEPDPAHALPPDLAALNTIMKAVGYELGQEAGEYTLTGHSGTYPLREEEVESLLNSSVQYVEFLCEKLEKEKNQPTNRRTRTAPPPWTPPAASQPSGGDNYTPAQETPAERKETPPQDNAQDGEEDERRE